MDRHRTWETKGHGVTQDIGDHSSWIDTGHRRLQVREVLRTWETTGIHSGKYCKLDRAGKSD